MTALVRPVPEGETGPPRLTVCINRRRENGISISCSARGSEALLEALRREAAVRGLALEIDTIRCLGLCEKGPNVRLAPGKNWFAGCQAEDAPAVLDAAPDHFGRPRRA